LNIFYLPNYYVDKFLIHFDNLDEEMLSDKFQTPISQSEMTVTQKSLDEKRAEYERDKISIMNMFQTVVLPAKIDFENTLANHPEKEKKSMEFMKVVVDYNQQRDRLIKQEGRLHNTLDVLLMLLFS
jgi:hypothetical protein